MFALIKYGVGCTLSIKHTLLNWSREMVPRRGVTGSSTGGPDLFCLSSCFCMGVHARWFRTGTPDACRRVAFVRAGRDGAHWVGGHVSLVFVGFARWLPRAFAHSFPLVSCTFLPLRWCGMDRTAECARFHASRFS